MIFRVEPPDTSRLVQNLVPLLVLGIGLCLGMGCAGTAGSERGWPGVDVLAAAPPADLDTAAATSTLRRGNDGFWYVVGGLDESVGPGAAFYARYSGEWPLEDIPRPPMAAGNVIKRYSDQVALVGLTYWLPDAERAELEVTWEQQAPHSGASEETGEEEFKRESLGKGLGVVTEVDPDDAMNLTLSVDEELGVQQGDMYAVLKPVDVRSKANQMQLSRRLLGVCMVRKASSESSTCRMWRGSPVHPDTRPVQVGDDIVFLEHTFGRAPRPAQVIFGKVEGAPDLQAWLIAQFDDYMRGVPSGLARGAALEQAFEARDIDFHRQSSEVEYHGSPQILVGASVHPVEGRDHLFVNYTGVGPATGPGMVAAPPERGVDLGPVDGLDPVEARNFAAMIYGAVLVYRGQTSEGLMHLHRLLSDPTFGGPMRWHTRDQFAMRWGALGFYEEALWLVTEDQAVAKAAEDQVAYLNALGTRVRLYDFVDLPQNALEAARIYLEARNDERPNTAYLSAVGMFAEMAMSAGEIDEALQAVAALKAACPDGCSSDLSSYLSGVYWMVPAGSEAIQDALLVDLLQLARGARPEQMAATRLYQGLNLLRQENMDQALIAFLEASRLYESANFQQGVARAQYFLFMTQLARGEAGSAFEHANQTLEIYTELRDFAGTARTYERMTRLYVDLDLSGPNQPHLAAARQVLSKAVQTQLARGDIARASEAMFAIGSFFFKAGGVEQSQVFFEDAIKGAVRTTRFDIAALSYLYMGVIAQTQGDVDAFRAAIERARLLGGLSGDPNVLEMIEGALRPPPTDDVPTKLL